MSVGCVICCGLIVYCLIMRVILSGSSLRKLLLTGLFGAFAAGELHGQTAADSARIYYRRGHREVDIRFRENGSELERFIGCVREVYETGRLEGVEIPFLRLAGRDGPSERNALPAACRFARVLHRAPCRDSRRTDTGARRGCRLGVAPRDGGVVGHALPRRGARHSRQYPVVDFRRGGPHRGRPQEASDGSAGRRTL